MCNRQYLCVQRSNAMCNRQYLSVQQTISICATDNIYHATFDVQQSLCRVQHTHAELAQHASAHLRYKTWRCRRASSRTRRARARAPESMERVRAGPSMPVARGTLACPVRCKSRARLSGRSARGQPIAAESVDPHRPCWRRRHDDGRGRGRGRRRHGPGRRGGRRRAGLWLRHVRVHDRHIVRVDRPVDWRLHRSARMCHGWAQSRRRCGRGAPSPGADVAQVGAVPVQMWQGCAESRCRCGRGGPTCSCTGVGCAGGGAGGAGRA
jgi:hypothetical protein